jgi:hypothetical protein
MRIDTRILTTACVAFSFSVACGSDTTSLAKGGTSGDASTDGNSSGTGGSGGGQAGSTGSGGKSGATGNGGTSGATTNGGTSGAAGKGGTGARDASAGGSSGASAGGKGGASAGGTGAGGTGTGGGSSGGAGPLDGSTICNRLAACCATAAAPFKPSCNNLVSQNDPASCQVALGFTFYCGTVDAGTPTPRDAGPAACTDLMACCAGQGARRAQCEQIAGLGNLASCATFASFFCP